MEPPRATILSDRGLVRQILPVTSPVIIIGVQPLACNRDRRLHAVHAEPAAPAPRTSGCIDAAGRRALAPLDSRASTSKPQPSGALLDSSASCKNIAKRSTSQIVRRSAIFVDLAHVKLCFTRADCLRGAEFFVFLSTHSLRHAHHTTCLLSLYSRSAVLLRS